METPPQHKSFYRFDDEDYSYQVGLMDGWAHGYPQSLQDGWGRPVPGNLIQYEDGYRDGVEFTKRRALALLAEKLDEHRTKENKNA